MKKTYTPVKNLLSKGSTNYKTAKNELETFILYLAPANTLEGFNLCPFASEGCKKACLYKAGRGSFNSVQLARINKTKFWAYDRSNFYKQLTEEILTIHNKTKKNWRKIAIRLNGTSDINHLNEIKRFTGIDFLSEEFEDLLFYDYTKSAKMIKDYKNSRYKLTFSLSESNKAQALEVLKTGGNVAAVFKNNLPQTFEGFEVINGDTSDLRYFDPVNVVVGLLAKGPAKKDLTGFVINN